MSLTDQNSMVMPVSPMGGYGGNSGYGFGGDGAWWLLVLFLFAMNGNWGGGFGGSQAYTVNNDVQRGFDQQSVMAGLNSLTTAVANGFSNAEVSRCNSQANVLQAINGVSTNVQNVGFNNSSALADLKYTVATEACADRNSISEALRDVIASNTANTQAILDKMCQQELDALKARNAELQTQLNIANMNASQVAQTSQILADNAAQTATLRQALNPTPIPAYVVQNPSCCNTGSYCGCNFA